MTVEELPPDDRFALAEWIERSEDIRELRHVALVREIEIGLDQLERGDCVEWKEDAKLRSFFDGVKSRGRELLSAERIGGLSLYRVARAAQRDLDEIWCYIDFFNARVADHWLDSVERRFKVLAKQPQVGQARPDLAPGTPLSTGRQLPDLYQPIENGVEIARVIHGARDLGPESF